LCEFGLQKFGIPKSGTRRQVHLREISSNPWIGDMHLLLSGKDRELSKFHLDVTAALAHRYVFIAKERYLGLGPENMQVGDQVFVVGGPNAPFILRQLDGDRIGSFQLGYCLIGGCYVYGIWSEALIIYGIHKYVGLSIKYRGNLCQYTNFKL
jgi:hypothetical protein